MDDRYSVLRLKNQLCFPLYAVSNLIIRKYKPLLNELDLTYTQYIVMMVLWEEKQVNEKFLCESLCLKSNTLTPLLKKLEEKGYITKRKDKSDERNLLITPTEEGEKLHIGKEVKRVVARRAVGAEPHVYARREGAGDVCHAACKL